MDVAPVSAIACDVTIVISLRTGEWGCQTDAVLWLPMTVESPDVHALHGAGMLLESNLTC